ncbi:glycosyltransferase [Formosa haliotis]|uniref:glycosyltransferase n=1 Tax=Formosa haliotis TaxID=1555194 RepID=UPI000826ECF2|nr:glycosyltransferase [Formosa haliotis]
MFVCHSYNNTKNLDVLNNSKFVIIDQCSYNQQALLNIQNKDKTKVFLTVSRLVKEKNLDVVIKAFIQSSSINDILLVVGEGEDLIRLKEIAKENKNIKFIGFVPNNELVKYYDQADCFIVSHFDLETGPLTAIDAMAAGLIILSARTGAMSERLLDYNLWFSNDVDDLSDLIKKVKLMSEKEIVDLSTNIRSYYRQYNQENIKNKYIELLK